MTAVDGDKGINAPIVYSFHTIDEQQPAAPDFLHLNPTSGELQLIGELPTSLSSTSGDDLHESKHQQVTSSLTLVIKASQADNKDRYALTTVTLFALPENKSSSSLTKQVLGTTTTTTTAISTTNKQQHPSIRFDGSQLVAEVFEDSVVGTKIAKVNAKQVINNRPFLSYNDESQTSPELSQSSRHSNFNVSYKILNSDTDFDASNQFGVLQSGEIYLKKELDYELKQEHKFDILANHQKYSDICKIIVKVKNVNDNKPKVSLIDEFIISRCI